MDFPPELVVDPKRCRRILVENLQPNILVGDLLKHFRFFGRVEDVYIENYNGPVDPARYGFVVYRNAAAVELALRFRNHVILGHTVSILMGHARIEVTGQLSLLSEADIVLHFSRFGHILGVSELTDYKPDSNQKVCVVTFYSDEVAMNRTRQIIKGVSVRIKELAMISNPGHLTSIEEPDMNALNIEKCRLDSENCSQLSNTHMGLPAKASSSCLNNVNLNDDNNILNFGNVSAPNFSSYKDYLRYIGMYVMYSNTYFIPEISGLFHYNPLNAFNNNLDAVENIAEHPGPLNFDSRGCTAAGFKNFSG